MALSDRLKLKIRESARPLVPEFVKPLIRDLLRPTYRGAQEYAFDGTRSVESDIQEKYGFSGDLLQIFVNNKDNVVHKWHHYLPIYDRYFSPFRGKKIRFLEIGVSLGGSLQMWRKYLGDDAIIFGIDNNEVCRKYDGQAAQVRIGSQDDPAFLRDVVDEMGGVDVVLDDGSHQMQHIRASLEYLFPRLSEGGIYMIEDLHTAYWEYYRGGYSAPDNFFGYVGELMHDMHQWYHEEGQKHPAASTGCSGIHVHDSIVVLEKTKVFPPVHSIIE